MPARGKLIAARVTVFIPTWNRARWLEQAIRSVLAQDYTDFLLVVSDNASTDETPDVVAGFDDDRLRYVRRPHNIGLLGNHNACLESLDTEFGIILSDDDRLFPEHLSRTVETLDRHPRVGMVHTGFHAIGPDGEILASDVNWTHDLDHDAVESGEEFIHKSMLWSCRVCAPLTLMRAEAIPAGLFLEEDFPAIDFGMWLRVALQRDVAFLAEPLGEYRFHGGSHSAAFGPPMGGGYVMGTEITLKLHALKMRFLDRYEARLRDADELRRLADRARTRELVQLMRNTTLPERRVRPTLRSFLKLSRIDRRVATSVAAWRLVAASLLGGRVVDRLKAAVRA